MKTKSVPKKTKKLKPHNKLLKQAQTVFNAYVRKRDEGLKCISCESWDTAHASHYFSAGKYSALRFDEWNVNASCIKCNTYLHGNLINYRMGLVDKIGEQAVRDLEEKSKVAVYKWTREELENIIQKYKL